MTIELKNITKAYGEGNVLSDVSFKIDSREFFVLVGPSGGGKTTLLKMVNRLIEPTSGEILIDGEDITKMNLRDLRLQIGYVLQQIALFPNLTVAENIGLVPQLKKWSKAKIEARVKELLPMVGLDAEKYTNRYPSELSGGEAQRIGILRAVAAEPKIILMDEPFSALDPISRKALQEMVKNLQHTLNITTVFVTHDMAEAMTLADYIAVIGDGTLQQLGTPNEILRQPANDFVAGFFKNYQQNLSDYTLGDLSAVSQTLSADTPLAEAVNLLSAEAKWDEGSGK